MYSAVNKIKIIFFVFGYLIVQPVYAALPDEYQAIVVKAPFNFSERVFDLNPAIMKARSENRNLFIYLGASDCPPCKDYEFFLRKNRIELKKTFDQLVVVDIQTWLRGPNIFFLIDSEKLTVAQFRAVVGDRNKQLVFPSFWLLTPGLQQVRQLPMGTTELLDVTKHQQLIR